MLYQIGEAICFFRKKNTPLDNPVGLLFTNGLCPSVAVEYFCESGEGNEVATEVLFQAAVHDHMEMLEYALVRGAEVNRTHKFTFSEHTALSAAASRGNSRIVQKLSTVDGVDLKGSEPLGSI